MVNFTKKALMNSFIQLLSEKSFDKITVQEIVHHCGVNRNTFYYHFQDIYMLLEEVFKDEEQRVVKALENNYTWEECCKEGIQFALSNKKAIYHLYYSMKREVLESYLGDVIEFILRKYISLKYGDKQDNKEILEFIIKFYKYGFVGILLEWIASGFSDELSNQFLEDMGNFIDNHMIDHFLNKE